MYAFSPYVRENLAFLKRLAQARTAREKNALVLGASEDQLLAIVEIVSNVLKVQQQQGGGGGRQPHFPLSYEDKRRLRRHADFYRSLARVRSVRGARDRLQSGGALPLSAILVPVLTSLAKSLVEKALES